MTVIFFGDSLFDIGNLTTLATPFGIELYPAPFYNDGKASNGQVLSEAIAARIGVDVESLIPYSSPTSPFNPLEENIVYAIAGATTGVFGSAGLNLQDFSIGLASQIQIFLENLPSNNTNAETIEVFITAGSNDILEILANPNFANIFITPDNDDNEALINNTVNNIVNNISQGIYSIENQTGDIFVVGVSPLGDIPFALQIDQQIDNNIPLDLAGQTSQLLNTIAQQVNLELINIFDNPLNDIANVTIIDGFEVFNNAVNNRQNDLESPLITQISYQNYLTGNTDLGENLTVEDFFFLDGSHPTSIANDYLADEIISQISESKLDTPIYRFQNRNIEGAYLYVAEEERQRVLANYPNFVEEGLAFNVADESDDELMPIYRFQNQNLQGAYLYVGEEERQNILENHSNFVEEGIAFYVYGVNSNQADSIYRFQNQNTPGAYLYVGETERQDILANYGNFREEGIAFEAFI